MSPTPGDLSAAVDHIEKVRQGLLPAQDLVPLFAEQSSFMHLLTAPEIERFRGYALSTFGMVGLPVNAEPIVLEELETGTEPYTIAAAAMAMLGAADYGQEAMDLLKAARVRVLARDVNVQYQRFEPIFDIASNETALGIIDDAIARLSSRRQSLPMQAPGPAAERSQCCCCGGADHAAPGKQVDPGKLVLEDQIGARTSFGAFFRGQIGILTFFYTRCMNPEKCSLTISNLARLQRALAEKNLSDSVRIGAISYDPAYDLPHRLAAYGRERGLIFGEGCRMFRSPNGFGEVQESFELAVGFGPQTVNRHQIELLLLDEHGLPFKRFVRMKWDASEVLAALEARITSGGT